MSLKDRHKLYLITLFLGSVVHYSALMSIRCFYILCSNWCWCWGLYW